jgi:hypothetical protein
MVAFQSHLSAPELAYYSKQLSAAALDCIDRIPANGACEARPVKVQN